MVRIEFTTDTAAFDDFPDREVAHILRGIAERINQGEIEGSVRDRNGIEIGFFDIQF